MPPPCKSGVPFPLLYSTGICHTFHAVHALDAVDTALAHGLAVTYVETSKLSTRQNNYLDAEQQHGHGNKTKGYKCEFQHNCLYLQLQR